MSAAVVTINMHCICSQQIIIIIILICHGTKTPTTSTSTMQPLTQTPSLSVGGTQRRPFGISPPLDFTSLVSNVGPTPASGIVFRSALDPSSTSNYNGNWVDYGVTADNDWELGVGLQNFPLSLASSSFEYYYIILPM